MNIWDVQFALDQFFILLTPAAIVTALVSGAALGFVIRRLRPDVNTHLTTFFAIVVGVLWYMPNAAQLVVEDKSPWATLSKFCLYLFAFVPAMWLVMRWRQR